MRQSTFDNYQGDAPWMHRDEEWLRRKYHEEGLSQSEIGDLTGVGQWTVGRMMERFGMETRSPGGLPNDLKYKDKEWLHEQYYEAGKSQKEIGEMCGVTQDTIHKWMWKFEFEPRSYGNASRSLPMRDPEWLREQYHDEGHTLEEMGEMCGVSGGSILRWMDKFGIPRRDPHKTPRSTVEETGHYVASKWEKEVDLMLHESEYDYGYEPETFDIVEREYTPDFRVADNIIEIKGYDWGKAHRRAELFMEHFPDLRYIVLGIPLPCDVHLPWEDRDELLSVL